MIHGIDTGFLVAAETLEHGDHHAARDLAARLLASGDRMALAPQVISEFLHVVTDPRRFSTPYDMRTARSVAERWWTARETVRVFPDEAASQQFFVWMERYRFGRKRLLDTLLAAT